MVLKKDRPPVGVENSGKMSNEQPVTKRQRIETHNNEQTESELNASPTHLASTSSSVPISDPTNGSIDSDEIDNASVLILNSHGIPIEFTIKTTTESASDFQSLQTYLAKQCLCGVTDQTLKNLFQSQYSHTNGVKRVATLSEWPTNKLLQFLSNIQLLFDVYLKQNSTGSICGRIKDVCDALILNERNLISDIIDLSNYNDKYVHFISGKLMASFLVIAKDSELLQYYLKKLVDNLFNVSQLNELVMQKISFTLDIFKRIIEWKDVDLHPLGEDYDESDLLPTLPPPIENNYFHYSTNQANSSSGAGSSDSSQNIVRRTDSYSTNNVEGGCHLEHLTDSESFDTTNLKCETVKMLENKWRALLDNMKKLILPRSNLEYGECAILTFLSLWESIISVQANLSVIDTHPFHAKLDQFEQMLNCDLSTTVYKQMLTLFNEALCYGSTLALQDGIPKETGKLAHGIINHVKHNGLLNSLPRQQQCVDDSVSLIGYNGPTVDYVDGSFQHFPNEFHSTESPQTDRTLLQKLVLLVLKSVAVSVREIRSDSSDSSIDSADDEAISDMILIEQNMREVLRKLEIFMKNKMEFHPATHFSKILIDLFGDQDDYLIESMVCTLDVVIGFSFRNNAFPQLVQMMNPVYIFLEFLVLIKHGSDLLLDLLVSNETCFLLYLLRFLKYIRVNWTMFTTSCRMFKNDVNELDSTMKVLKRLRLKISKMVSRSQYPYDISPILRLLESCENLHEGNELS